MSDGTRIGSRTLLAAVAVSALLYAIAVVPLGTPPGAAASGAEVVSWLRDHGDGVRWSAWASTLSAVPVAIMFALLRGLLPAPHRDVFLIGALGIVATTSVQFWIWLGLALHPERLEPATARTVLDVALFWGPVLTASTVTMMAAPTWLALRGEAGLPRWLGVLGLVVSAEQLVETITIFGTTGFTEPGGAMNLQLGAGLFWLWLLSFAVWAGLRGRYGPARNG
jgi:hypothetical protein